VITLSKFDNYIRHENDGNEIVLTDDIDIFIDDTTNVWQKGQSLRLVFADEFNPAIFNVTIRTDALGLTNNGVYGKIIAVYDDIAFTPPENKPIFEIICVQQNPLTFKVDQIR
jgi:hypothetical protein